MSTISMKQGLPLAVRGLQGVGAWICAILLMVAIAVGPVMMSGEHSVLVLAPLFAAGGYWLAARNDDGFLADLGVPLCMAGLGLLPLVLEQLGVRQHDWWDSLDYVYAGPSLLVWWFARNRQLQFVAALVLAMIGWYWLGGREPWYGYDSAGLVYAGVLRDTLVVVLLAWWWLLPPSWGERLAALRWALGLVALGMTLGGIDSFLRPEGSGAGAVGGTLLQVLQFGMPPALALLGVMAYGIRREQLPLRWLAPWLAVLPLVLMSPLFLYPLLFLWLAMLVPGRHRLLNGLGGAGAVYAFSRFYYLLDWPLLLKGVVLLGAGSVLLLLAWVLRRGSQA
ncbi:DUF4401 domain-containing protein [Chitinilyticum piscinae]|uniref:DUF4401 domain-containing protein n=1 Tax=Chitinilyticum piscinae TaxID=2866724 RepID=A0A8J7FLV9_9NEIS|nr:DUF4401 domain-containing protein [Chitinilyticum piscinae]MBE9608654.1 DUF4401 domain-containing protein [Chitinilyticum piscinae]